ncbi:hypothetical protein GPN2_13037 [Streptomyces murinus]
MNSRSAYALRAAPARPRALGSRPSRCHPAWEGSPGFARTACPGPAAEGRRPRVRTVPLVTAPDGPVPKAPARSAPSRSGRSLRLALCLAPLLIALCWAVANRPVVYEGYGGRLGRSPLAAGRARLYVSDLGGGLLRTAGRAPGPAAGGAAAGLAVRRRCRESRAARWARRARRHRALSAGARCAAGPGHRLDRPVLAGQGRLEDPRTAGVPGGLAAWRRLGELVPDGPRLLPVAAVAGGVVTGAGCC